MQPDGKQHSPTTRVDLSDPNQVAALIGRMSQVWAQPQSAAPIIGGHSGEGSGVAVRDPADTTRVVGTVVQATAVDVERAYATTAAAQPRWAARPVEERVACLTRMADLLEVEEAFFMALTVREAGKTLRDAQGEVAEAVDFCRYYAAGARELFQPVALPGPTGESNELRVAARGVFACISPWNFPLAIFLGQIVAALVTGNAVIAKPAPQTPLIAAAAIRLLIRAGVPADVVALLPGTDEVGAAMIADRRLAGVAFTGSNATAHRIARALLLDGRPILPLIAETGGLNAMLVDASAAPDKVVSDAVVSAFYSAGQRCSALRLLCLPQQNAAATLELLGRAMADIRVGDPAQFETRVGPVIDAEAAKDLNAYIASQSGRIAYRTPVPPGLSHGHFVTPVAIRLGQMEELQREVFGPVLHIVTWNPDEVESWVDRINATGYGLTMGVQSTNGEFIERVRARAHVGNLYVNRTIVGAVVGTQPFGGEGLSGTGFKAGGPHYLLRFVTERVFTVNTTAAGGDISLLKLAG